MKQLHSSEVIAKYTSSLTMFDSIYQELLSLHQLASCQHEHQHLEGWPEEDGCGGQVVQKVVERHPFSGSALFGRQCNDVCLFVILPGG